MQIFQKEIKVTKADLDQLNHVNNVRYVQWVQDVAEAHWLQNTTETIKTDYYWVLVNHNISYKGAALLNDTILIKTYVVKSEGVTSIRKVEMYNKTNNKLIVESETKWCLMSGKTHRPMRITTEVADLFN